MARIDASKGQSEPVATKASPCPHAPSCPGCALIGRPYGEQLDWKQKLVADLFAEKGAELPTELLPIVGSPGAFGYRNQAKLVLRRTRRGLLAGLYRQGTHQVVDIRSCPVHALVIQRVLTRVLPILEKSGLSTYDERTRVGVLRYLILRSSDAEQAVQVILVTATPLDDALRLLLRTIGKLKHVRSVVHDHNDDPGNVLLAYRFTYLTRQTQLVERIGPFRLGTQAGTFLQVNPGVARRLYRYALEEARPASDRTALDLYCGAGALSLYLATAARLVIGVEENPLAVADAKSNARRNGFANLRFFQGQTAAVLPRIASQLDDVEVVTLNPPRKGVDEATREAVVQLAPQRIVYVSCAPSTLARDLRWFAQRGYRTVRVRPFDLMPQTDHIECVATLEKRAA